MGTTRPKNSEAEILELYRVALQNAETQPEIAAAMTLIGYNSAKIAEGKTLWAQTRAAFDANKTEDDETSEAYNNFTTLKGELDATYGKHRKKAKVVFRNDSLNAEKLGITGEMPRAYVKSIEAAKKFYNEVSANESILTQLGRLAVTSTEITAAIALIANVETARANYLREAGESQTATKAKDAAFAQMDEWMSDFYAVARIALEDSPQLLEVLGKIVKG